jgi:spore germination protein (amino acid permease)
MNNNQSKLKETLLISPFFMFYLVHSSQTGVGLLSFQSDISKESGYDAWIGLLIAGLILHIILFITFKLLEHSSDGDLISLHRDYFGKLVGNTLTILFCIHFLLFLTTVFWSYIEILQVWAFETIHAWEFTLVLSIIVFYIVIGGFRVITGITFFSTIIPIILVFILIYTLKFSHFSNLLPVLSHDAIDILKSAKASTFSFLGFEALLIYFPFIRNRDKGKKWAYIGLLFTTVSYTILAIITFSFFSEGQLKHLLKPTLVLTKIVEIPFIERFEYIFIFSWFLVVLPPICISLWSVTRVLKSTLKIKPSYSLISIIILLNLSTIIIMDKSSIDILSKISSEIGFYIILVYLPVLYIYVLIVNFFRNKKT